MEFYAIMIIFYTVISTNTLSGTCGTLYGIQGLRNEYEFKNDRKLFVTYLIVRMLSALTSFFIYKHIITPSPTSLYFHWHVFTLLQHVIISLMYSYWMSPAEKFLCYLSCWGILIFWSAMKIFGVETFDKPETITAAISQFFLMMLSFRVINNMNRRFGTARNLSIDAHFQILSINALGFGAMMTFFILATVDKRFFYYIAMISILMDGYYMYALYLFTKRGNSDIHDWL